MRFRSLEIFSPLFNFAVILFIVFRNIGTGCGDLVDVNISIFALVVSVGSNLLILRGSFINGFFV